MTSFVGFRWDGMTDLWGVVVLMGTVAGPAAGAKRRELKRQKEQARLAAQGS